MMTVIWEEIAEIAGIAKIAEIENPNLPLIHLMTVIGEGITKSVQTPKIAQMKTHNRTSIPYLSGFCSFPISVISVNQW
ncbi:MAG: hypothetical protein ACJ71U_03390 [Terriglobales bacterium]